MSVAIVKPLPKLVLLPPFAVNALKVESLLEKLTLEALAVVKLTVVALLLFAADIPSTVILPVELSPIFKVPAVIFPSSVPVIVIFPDVPPKPIVPPSDTAIVVEPVPLEIVPAISTSSASIVMLALSSVVRALPEAMVNVPVPLSSESGLKVTDDAIVRSPLTVIPFPAFTVTCLIVEAVVPNSTDPLEPLEFNVTPPEICERVTPSTYILPLELSPITNFPAVMSLNSLCINVNPQAEPLQIVETVDAVVLAVVPSNPIVSPLPPRMVNVPAPASNAPDKVKSVPVRVISPPLVSMAPTDTVPPALITILPPEVSIVSDVSVKDIFPVVAVKVTLCPLV